MSTLSGLFPSGGGNAREKTFIFLTTSGTWTAPYDMDIVVHAIGGFGTGAVLHGLAGGATGAGAPGYTRKKTRLSAGAVLTNTIGAAGAIVGNVGGTGRLNGNSGGTTTVTGGGLNLVANGGGGGLAGIGGAAVSGGAGGTASGGDVNYTGGRGGNIGFQGDNSSYRATGAGAVNILGTGDCNGGDITGGSNITIYQATGGGSIGGSGYSLTFNNGASSPGSALAATGILFPTVPIGRSILGIGVVGPAGGSGVSPGPFMGSTGFVTTSGTNAWFPGIFGGFGAIVASNSVPVNVTNNSVFASGGGVGSGDASSGTYSMGYPGVIVLEILT